MSQLIDGGPKKDAAEMGRHNSNPLIVRMGSNANKACDASSPRTVPISVERATSVMWIRVSGRIDLYFWTVVSKWDSSSCLAAPTFVFPVAVLALEDDEEEEEREESEPVLPDFLRRLDAPPLKSNIAFEIAFVD